MRKRNYVLIGIILLLASVGWIIFRGGGATVVFDYPESYAAEDITVSVDEPGVIEVAEVSADAGRCVVTVEGLKSGKAFLVMSYPDGEQGKLLFVHRTGVVTEGGYFGGCRGGQSLPLMGALFALILLAGLIRKHRADMAKDLYRYRNITDLGLIIFLVFLLADMVLQFFRFQSIVGVVKGFLYSAQLFATLALPVVAVFSLLISISHIYLMSKEGRSWRNMLGTILGFLVMIMTLAPIFLGAYLQRTTIVDVHNEQGAGMYIEAFVENTAFIAVVYLECILLATVIILGKASRRMPDPDRDYMMVLGCKVGNNGKPLPLLKGRADRALEFAAIQKEKSGKELTFVPSGGQGQDEPMSEGRCVADYFIGSGVPAERIIPEEKSTSTEENFRFSLDLIQKDREEKGLGGEPAKIAFATTNYHVFRAGLIAREMGVEAQGIGSRTKSYFHFNAFVREFIAILVQEKRAHIKVIGSLLLAMIPLIAMLYLDAMM